MSDSPSSSNFVYLIIGLLVAAAAAFGIYYFTEGDGGPRGLEVSVGEDGVKIDAR